MKRREATIHQNRHQLEVICQTVPATSLPLIHYVGARLSQDDVDVLKKALATRGLTVDVFSKGHDVHIVPKVDQET